MSVVKSKRGASQLDYLFGARALYLHTLRKCVNFPKRYTFYIAQPTAKLAHMVYHYVTLSSQIEPPTNAHQVQLKRDYLLKAKATVYSLISEIEVAHQIFGLDPKEMKAWMDLVNKEIKFIERTIDVNTTRYKNVK